jgi:multiple sugar transport system substrate-binding protein
MLKRQAVAWVAAIMLLFAAFYAGATGKTESQKAADAKVTIKYAVWDYSLAPEYKETIAAFQKANPNITVEPLEISSKEYTDKITIMLAGGDETDVLAMKDVPTYSGYIMRKQILPLDDIMAKDGMDLAPYAGILTNVKLGGKLYQLPFRSDFWVLYYNKGIFDNAGVPYPTNDMTFDQFRATAKQITSGTANDKVYGSYIHTWKSCVINWPVADKKGTLIDGVYGFIKPGYDVFLPMQNEDQSVMDFATAKTSSAHYKGQFESGKAGMVLMGTWFIGTLITDKKAGGHNVNWSMVKAPHFPGSPAGTTFGNVTGNAINALSKNQDAAWKFVKYIGTEEGAKIFAARGVMPAYRTSTVVKVYQSVAGFPEDGSEALKTASVALEFPPQQYAAAIDKALQEEHELIMIGKNTPDVGIAEMERRVKDIMAGN